ncbi:hypothetical protein NQ317_011261 [Molorchus minor]|uniref:DDE Tnp4 domain-containing protein n=1 Tax=Molorchus minor TaxID=1323400 RepID=A0ABQ9JL04_9CUCU|nr:hypothetical protein NQ317_011261 [Molorchus minor]
MEPQIAISAPSVNNELFPPLLFYNRKGFYSLNVQIICGSKLKIMAINARFSGSVHDAATLSDKSKATLMVK